jgi:hypothetical protein
MEVFGIEACEFSDAEAVIDRAAPGMKRLDLNAFKRLFYPKDEEYRLMLDSR